MPGLIPAHRALDGQRDQRELAPEGTSARISQAKAVQLSNRPAGPSIGPAGPLQPSGRGPPGPIPIRAGGSSFVWFTMVADGVGPSMQFDPATTSWTVMASEY